MLCGALTVSMAGCSDDDDPQPDTTKKETTDNSGENDSKPENQGNKENQNPAPDDSKKDENETKKINVAVEGNSDVIQFSQTSFDVKSGDEIELSYTMLDDKYDVVNVSEGWIDRENKIIQMKCWTPEDITVKVGNNTFKLSIYLSDGGNEKLLDEVEYKVGETITYQLPEEYKGYHTISTRLFDPWPKEYHTDIENAFESTANYDFKDTKIPFDLLKTGVSIDIFTDGNFSETIDFYNNDKCGTEYEFDLTQFTDYGFAYDNFQNSNYKLTVNQDGTKVKYSFNTPDYYTFRIYFKKEQVPVNTDTRQSIAGKFFCSGGIGFEFTKNSDNKHIMNYYTVSAGQLVKSRVYVFEKYDDWSNIFEYNGQKWYIYVSDKIQITEYNGIKSEMAYVDEVESFEAMKNQLLK